MITDDHPAPALAPVIASPDGGLPGTTIPVVFQATEEPLFAQENATIFLGPGFLVEDLQVISPNEAFALVTIDDRVFPIDHAIVLDTPDVIRVGTFKVNTCGPLGCLRPNNVPVGDLKLFPQPSGVLLRFEFDDGDQDIVLAEIAVEELPSGQIISCSPFRTYRTDLADPLPEFVELGVASLHPGDYVVLGILDDGIGRIQVTEAPLTVQPCDVAVCADLDNNGIRDSNCIWWSCNPCIPTSITFADVGGAFGDCIPDGAADANDRFHALNCFSNTTTSGLPPYPCELNPPQAFNVDAGGPFGQCCPDGVCDGNDAFHALNAFSGVNPCMCPPNFVCSCPGPTEPPSNPAYCPQGGSPTNPPIVGPVVTGTAAVILVPSTRQTRPAEIVSVDAFLEGDLDDLRGFQLQVSVRGGRRGQLELVDMSIEGRDDFVFAELASWKAFNVETGQMLAGLDSEGVPVSGRSYLGTFTYRVGEDAMGQFVIELMVYSASAEHNRSFLFPTPAGAQIVIESATAATIDVVRRRGRGERIP